jgi:CBS domain-containing protein
MKVSETMRPDVIGCRPADSLARAAQIMWERDCGCVPVTDGQNRLRGMITDRDVAMAALLCGQTLAAVPVEKVMAQKVQACQATDELEAALQTMAKNELRRLPVVDDQRRLVGLLSLADVVQTVARSDGKARRTFVDGLFDTWVGVTKPRHEPARQVSGKVPAQPARTTEPPRAPVRI